MDGCCRVLREVEVAREDIRVGEAGEILASERRLQAAFTEVVRHVRSDELHRYLRRELLREREAQVHLHVQIDRVPVFVLLPFVYEGHLLRIITI